LLFGRKAAVSPPLALRLQFALDRQTTEAAYDPLTTTTRFGVLLVIGRVRCDSEKREELITLLRHMQDDSRREEGCLRYGFFAAVEDEHSFIAVEEWQDREALDRHFSQPHLHEFSRRLLELVSVQPEVAIHEIAGTSLFRSRWMPRA
jgi:quinol monooxygenase YgiN